MELFLSQEFTPEGHRGPTAFQIWNEDDGRYLVREVPYEMPETRRHYESLDSAKSALMSLMVDRGYEPKGAPCRDHIQEHQIEAGVFLKARDRNDRYVVYGIDESTARSVEIRDLLGDNARHLSKSHVCRHFELIEPEAIDRFERILLDDLCPEKTHAP